MFGAFSPRVPSRGVTASDSLTALALRAQAGDAGALAALVRGTQAEVWRFTAALVDPGSADDLTQETYLRAFKALDAYEARAGVRTWLLGIARRACADHVRAAQRRRRLDARLAAQLWADRPHQPDPAHRFGAADLLGRLGDQRRTAFVLTQVLGLSYAEAAEVEEVPVGTIRSRVARAREDLVAAVSQAQAS
jgi:RNA polymerase sigma-70 factor, ECF subfamily